ncbi:MAG: M67 family metallopeptidase [Planctomycetota bacterium]
MMSIEIPREILEQIIEQARAEALIEACGILAGKGKRVEQLYKMTNVDNSCDHFMMEPREQFSIVKEMRSAGLTMLGIYHSHPASPARPSEEDIRLALTPGVAYVIVSLKSSQPTAKAFVIEDGKAAEIALSIVETNNV